MKQVMRQVERQEFVEYVNRLPGKPVPRLTMGQTISVAQVVVDGVLVAQAIYNRGMPPEYQVRD